MTSLDMLIENLRNQLADESKVAAEYSNLSAVAYNLGFVNDANALADIARDEERHHERLSAMIERLTNERATFGLAGPDTRTYGYWVDLGLDIKSKAPFLAMEVNQGLDKINEGAAGAEEAKRWLTSKAGELGIT